MTEWMSKQMSGNINSFITMASDRGQGITGMQTATKTQRN